MTESYKPFIHIQTWTAVPIISTFITYLIFHCKKWFNSHYIKYLCKSSIWNQYFIILSSDLLSVIRVTARIFAELDASEGIAGYRISNPPMLLAASLQASLEVSVGQKIDQSCKIAHAQPKDIRRLQVGRMCKLLSHNFRMQPKHKPKAILFCAVLISHISYKLCRIFLLSAFHSTLNLISLAI